MYIYISILLLTLILLNTYKKSFVPNIVNTNPNLVKSVIVISRYNEDLNWLRNEPFNKYQYIVYNKGKNEDYYKSEKFKYEVKLKNVGRETHTYLTHIINNYINLDDYTIFLPGSIELENRYQRTKRLFYKIGSENGSKDLFACVATFFPVVNVYKDFKIDKYLSSNKNNKTMNPDDSMKLSDIRPYSKWYETLFNNKNIDSKCFTQNSIFALTKDTILKKPLSYYQELIKQVNEHNNHETVHYFERSWETVFYPYSNMEHVF